jgi:two-component system sensor histidine kinase AgrC
METIYTSIVICTTIIFGIIVQMILLDVQIKRLSRKRQGILLVGNLLVFGANLWLSLVIPVDMHMRLYVAVIHIPIFIIFWLITRISPIKVFFSLITAVFLIFPANAASSVISGKIKVMSPPVLYLFYITVCGLMILVIYRLFKPYFSYLIKNYSGRSFIKLCLLPLAYYIANYWLGMYNYNTAMSMPVLMQRSFLFIITLIAYLLIFDIIKSAREKEELRSAKMALSLLLEGADKQLSTLRATQEQAAIYRHDMRHHLALIDGYLAEGGVDKAVSYIRLTQADIQDITPNSYCENSTVNLIISSFVVRAKKSNVALSVEAQLPQILAIPETELCAILSNGLENAINAAAQVADGNLKNVRINCQTHKGNLLILIENSFTGKVTMAHGLPQSNREGHGLGVKSMAMIAEKYNGYCAFETMNDIFTMRLVLPLQEARSEP